jgi:hypothetical protein
LAGRIAANRTPHLVSEVHWIAGTPTSTYPDEEWTAPRTVA